MITGAHAILFSSQPEADRAFLRDALGLPHIDVGGGWLIFALPPSEVAVHDAGGNAGAHELYLMCDDVEAFVHDMEQRGLACSEIEQAGWGRVTRVTLPGGGKLGVYQPRHARPEGSAAQVRRATRAASKVARTARGKAQTGKTKAAKTKRKPARKKRKR